MKRQYYSLILIILLLFSPCALAQEKENPVTKVGDTQNAPYLRLDFQLKGATCVACIRRISKRLRSSKGIVKADISILTPYEGVVVFEGKKTNLAKIESDIKSEERRASLTELQLTALDAVPALILPRAKTP